MLPSPSPHPIKLSFFRPLTLTLILTTWFVKSQPYMVCPSWQRPLSLSAWWNNFIKVVVAKGWWENFWRSSSALISLTERLCLRLNRFFRDLMDLTWTHLSRVQVSMTWPGALSLTALTNLHQIFSPYPFNNFTPQLPSKHSCCPCVPLLLHMKEANHRCDLPLFTSDPPDTRITTSIPAPPNPSTLPPPN